MTIIGVSKLEWLMMANHHVELPDNNAMHAKSGLRVVLKWKIYRPDSVIAAVIRFCLQELIRRSECVTVESLLSST